MSCKCPQNTPKFICQSLHVYSVTNTIHYRMCCGSSFYKFKPMILKNVIYLNKEYDRYTIVFPELYVIDVNVDKTSSKHIITNGVFL